MEDIELFFGYIIGFIFLILAVYSLVFVLKNKQAPLGCLWYSLGAVIFLIAVLFNIPYVSIVGLTLFGVGAISEISGRNK